MNSNNTQKINKQRSFFFELKDFSIESIKIVILSLIVIIGIRTYIMQPFFVSGKSMEPNFRDGDYLIVDEISYRLGEPSRGDVIVFHYPNNFKEYYIKRIIGLPGEKVEIFENKIKIYNVNNPEGFEISEQLYIPETTITTGTYTRELKNDEYYVLGDNRTASADSRIWGVLEKHYIVGRAWIRAWPFDNFSVFAGIDY
ncbi:signal peptidase I [Patescibacteria group bacterium]|nr:signal peptidase I [Patescibacteria group bacterium]